jgi:hypothetical protein
MENSSKQNGNSTDSPEKKTSKSIGKVMLYIIIALCIFIFSKIIGVVSKDNLKSSYENTQNKMFEDCERQFDYGSISICLPKFNEMTECFSDLRVKESLGINSNGLNNKVLAVYLTNETYNSIDSLNGKIYDNYFTVYTSPKFIDQKVRKADFDYINSELLSSFGGDMMSNLKDSINMKQSNFSIDRPLLIEKYSLADNCQTYILLSEYSKDGSVTHMNTFLNTAFIKEKVIFCAYYMIYDGNESVNKAKAKNDYLVLRFLNANKE